MMMETEQSDNFLLFRILKLSGIFQYNMNIGCRVAYNGEEDGTSAPAESFAILLIKIFSCYLLFRNIHASSMLIASTLPCCAAKSNTLKPRPSTRFLSAPCASNNFTNLLRPNIAANISAVPPLPC